MNNQVMLEALEAQLSVKQNEADKYRDEVYTPQLKDLKTRAIEMLNSTLCPDLNLIKNVEIHSDSMGISISEKDRYGTTINFQTRGWNDENRAYEFCWYSGNVSTEIKEVDRNYGILIGRISEKFEKSVDLVRHIILPEYRKIEDALKVVGGSIRDLQTSIRQLKEKIDLDNKSHYYKPGFQLKLKEFKDLEWFTEDDDANCRKLISKPGSIKLITGRSKYDYDYVVEFKVIRKKGYKYVLEIKNHYNPEVANEVEVTDMRFQEFVNNVYQWENVEADKKTKRAEERYEEYLSHKQSTTLPTIKL